MKRARASEVIEALKERGFHYSGKDASGQFTLIGELACAASEQGIRCELVLDPDFFGLPRVRLLDIRNISRLRCPTLARTETFATSHKALW